MMALLSPKVWLALALAALLAFTHTLAWRNGSAHTQAAWNAAKVVQQQALSDFNAEARRMEQRRQSLATEAANAAQRQTQLARKDAAGARAERDGLRDDLAAARTQLAGASENARAKYSAAVDTVFAECTRRYLEMAESAQGHAIDSLMYQRAWPAPPP